MTFNSISYLLFLPIVFILYWFLAKKSLKAQNILLLIASYFFYACWDYRFLFLIIFSTFLDYFTGIKIYEAKTITGRKYWLWLSILVNLGFLGFFKYFNFFTESFGTALSQIGIITNTWTLEIILPIGISFYTFHGLSYVIDLFKRRISPEYNFINYSLFVSFFPLLVAGPIERATHLLPQIKKTRNFDYSRATDGLRQILWGLVKKIVVADNCAAFADNIFNNYASYNGSTLIIGTIFFAVQIYCDFSGYSDIAIGTARLFGINLLRNFAYPYFSRDIAEFWRRWHISLSSWFRDYIYIPLGGRRGSKLRQIKNIFIIFLLSGFWHGANWTFIIWGLLNALYITPSILFKTNRNYSETVAKGKYFPTLKELYSMAITFTLTTFAWIFFRSENVGQAKAIIAKIFSPSVFQIPDRNALSDGISIYLMIFILVFFTVIEWLGRQHQYAIAGLNNKYSVATRWSIYFVFIGFIYFFSFTGKNQQFIYFQF